MACESGETGTPSIAHGVLPTAGRRGTAGWASPGEPTTIEFTHGRFSGSCVLRHPDLAVSISPIVDRRRSSNQEMLQVAVPLDAWYGSTYGNHAGDTVLVSGETMDCG